MMMNYVDRSCDHNTLVVIFVVPIQYLPHSGVMHPARERIPGNTFSSAFPSSM